MKKKKKAQDQVGAGRPEHEGVGGGLPAMGEAAGVSTPPAPAQYVPTPAPPYDYPPGGGAPASEPAAVSEYVPTPAPPYDYPAPAPQSYPYPYPTEAAPPPRSRKKVWPALLVVLLVFLLFLGAGGVAGWVLLERRKAAEAAKPAPGETDLPAVPALPPGGGGRDPSRPSRPGDASPPPRPGGVGGEQQSPLGFSAGLPNGWTSHLDGSVETFSNGKQDENVALIQVADQGVSGSDLLEYLNRLNQKLTNEQGYRVESNPQAAKYGQLNAARARYLASSGGNQFSVEVYVVKAPDGRIFQIQNVAVVEFFPSHVSAFQSFANSFRFL